MRTVKDPRVFISYAHHPEGRPQAFLELATRLRNDGVNLCFDRFDPAPDAGWPTWMQEELAQADIIVLGCSPAYARRFQGDLDALGGRGVRWEGRIILNLAYDEENLGRFVPVVVDGDDPREVVPPVFGGGTHFGFLSEYSELLAHIGAGTRIDGEPSMPPVFNRLEPVTQEVAVVGGKLAHELAQDLGADIPVDANSDAASAARVVVVTDDSPMDRLEAAPDRTVIRVDALKLREAEARRRIKEDVRRRRIRHQRQWWRSSGRDLLVGAAVALVWPLLSAHLEHNEAGYRATLALAAGLLCSGAFLLAGVAGGLNPGYPVLSVDRLSVGEAWRYLRRSVQLAQASTSPTDRRRVLALMMGLVAMLWTLYFWRRGVGDREGRLAVAEYVLALGLGTLSWVSALRGGRAWLGSASALIAASLVPRFIAQWGTLVCREDVLAVLSALPDVTAPATWVAATPSALPLSVLAGSGTVFLIAWMAAYTPSVAWLRRLGLGGVVVLVGLFVTSS